MEGLRPGTWVSTMNSEGPMARATDTLASLDRLGGKVQRAPQAPRAQGRGRGLLCGGLATPILPGWSNLGLKSVT